MRAGKAALLAALTLAAALAATPARAAEVPEEQPDAVARRLRSAVEEQLAALELEGWDTYLTESSLSGQGARRMLDQILAGEPLAAVETMLTSSRDALVSVLRQAVAMLLQLTAVLVFASILQRTTQSLESGEAARGAELVLYLCMATVVAGNFFSIHRATAQAVGQMTAFFDYLLPLLLILLAATGGIATAAGLQPTLALSLRVLSSVLVSGVLPVTLACAAMVLIDNLAMEKRLSKVVDLLKTLCKWAMGSVMTILTAVISIQGASLASYDGISIRTAKYTVDAMVPVVGGMLSDLAEVLVAGSALVKNAVGTLGLVTLLALVAQPVLQVAAFVLVLRVAGAMAAPLGAQRIGGALDECAAVAVLWLVALIVLAAFLFLLVFIALAAGNAVLMYR